MKYDGLVKLWVNFCRLLLLLARLSLTLTEDEIIKLEAALTPTIHSQQEQVGPLTNSIQNKNNKARLGSNTFTANGCPPPHPPYMYTLFLPRIE